MSAMSFGFPYFLTGGQSGQMFPGQQFGMGQSGFGGPGQSGFGGLGQSGFGQSAFGGMGQAGFGQSGFGGLGQAGFGGTSAMSGFAPQSSVGQQQTASAPVTTSEYVSIS